MLSSVARKPPEVMDPDSPPPEPQPGRISDPPIDPPPLMPWQVPIPNTALFVTGAGDGVDISYNDIKQGWAGDCYFLATAAAIAKQNPDAIRSLIRENKDARGNVTSYTVSLWEKESTWFGLSSTNRRREINVPAAVETRDLDRLGDTTGGKNEVWPLILEKAFAQLDPRYWDGGKPEEAYFALTGWDAVKRPVNGLSATEPNAFIKLALREHRPVMLCTVGHPGDVLAGGIAPAHCYSVNGYHVDPRTGREMVDLYNPWGFDVSLPVDDMEKVFKNYTIG